MVEIMTNDKTYTSSSYVKVSDVEKMISCTPADIYEPHDGMYFGGLSRDRLRQELEKLPVTKDVFGCNEVNELIRRIYYFEGWLDLVFGDQETFWGIDESCIENPIREIRLDKEHKIEWYDGWKTVYFCGIDENGCAWEFTPDDVGKRVFLTEEEAIKFWEENQK